MRARLSGPLRGALPPGFRVEGPPSSPPPPGGTLNINGITPSRDFYRGWGHLKAKGSHSNDRYHSTPLQNIYSGRGLLCPILYGGGDHSAPSVYSGGALYPTIPITCNFTIFFLFLPFISPPVCFFALQLLNKSGYKKPIQPEKYEISGFCPTIFCFFSYFVVSSLLVSVK